MKIFLLSIIENPEQLEKRIKEKYPDSRLKTVRQMDIAHKMHGQPLSYFKGNDYDLFIIGTSNLKTQRLKNHYKRMALSSKAKRSLFLDEFGDAEYFSKWTFFSKGKIVESIALLAALLQLIYIHLLIRREESGAKKGVEKTLNRRPCSRSRIAFLRTDFWFNLKIGGSVTHTAEVINGLSRLGFEVKCFTTDLLYEVDRQKVEMHCIYPARLFNNLSRFPNLPAIIYHLKFVREVLPILRKDRPHAIYQRYSAFNFSGVTLSRILKVPLILEFNSSQVWISKYWARKQTRLSKLLKRIEDLNLRAADVVIVVSETLKRDVLALDFVDESRILVNPNGVDTEKFSQESAGGKGAELRRQLGIVDKKTVVGFCGTFGVWHGVPALAGAIDRLKAPDSRLKADDLAFLLMGDGELRADIEGKVGKFKDVIFTGQIPYSRIQEYYAICDILVSPHLPQADGREFFGSPVKLFEYMAMAKGIVASNLGQIGTVLAHGETAWLVEPGNIDDLVDGILKLAGDKELRERLGKNAREEVLRKYTWERNVKRVVERLERIGSGC